MVIDSSWMAIAYISCAAWLREAPVAAKSSAFSAAVGSEAARTDWVSTNRGNCLWSY